MATIDLLIKYEHLTLQDGQAFVMLVHDSAAVAFLCSVESTSANMQMVLNTAASCLKGKKSQLSAKIIGKEPLITRMRLELSKAGIAVTRVHRADRPTEIRFWPDQARVQVAKIVANESNKLRVLVVDDSQTMQRMLKSLLEKDGTIEVVSCVDHPARVAETIERLRPDAMTLDIHMPGQDGASLMSELWPRFHLPTVIVTSLRFEEGSLVFKALENGAIDYVQKPDFANRELVGASLRERIAEASKVNKRAKCTAVGRRLLDNTMDQERLIAIGSSTGGTEALKSILTVLPERIPPILIVQHIPPLFSKAFAERLNGLCPFRVKEAEDGDLMTPGTVYIAAGGQQMRVVPRRGKVEISVFDGAPVNRHKPSVDVLFDSVAGLCAKKTVGVILTGMGADGARGLLHLKQAGGVTIAQDEESCVVFGMPKEAIALGAADYVKPLAEIPGTLLHLIRLQKAS